MSLQDYGRYGDLSPYYEDLSPKGMIQGSSEFGQGRIISLNTARSIKTDGYGGTMVFGLTPTERLCDTSEQYHTCLLWRRNLLTGSYAKDWVTYLNNDTMKLKYIYSALMAAFLCLAHSM